MATTKVQTSVGTFESIKCDEAISRCEWVCVWVLFFSHVYKSLLAVRILLINCYTSGVRSVSILQSTCNHGPRTEFVPDINELMWIRGLVDIWARLDTWKLEIDFVIQLVLLVNRWNSNKISIDCQTFHRLNRYCCMFWIWSNPCCSNDTILF